MQLLSLAAAAAIISTSAALPSGDRSNDLAKREFQALYSAPNGLMYFECAADRFVKADDVKAAFTRIKKENISMKRPQFFNVKGIKNNRYPHSFENRGTILNHPHMGRCSPPGNGNIWEEFPIRDHGDDGNGVVMNRMIYQRGIDGLDTVEFFLCGVITHDGALKRNDFKKCDVKTMADIKVDLKKGGDVNVKPENGKFSWAKGKVVEEKDEKNP